MTYLTSLRDYAWNPTVDYSARKPMLGEWIAWALISSSVSVGFGLAGVAYDNLAAGFDTFAISYSYFQASYPWTALLLVVAAAPAVETAFLWVLIHLVDRFSRSSLLRWFVPPIVMGLMHWERNILGILAVTLVFWVQTFLYRRWRGTSDWVAIFLVMTSHALTNLHWILLHMATYGV